ncbi:type II secretion system GspH family protein, partial [Porticoccaceae bacterium]|nr:type II secretion system GspH family protein [Porticoccaceae bacterium]
MVKAQKGFTLIEMLVTMVLLSSIVLIGSNAYSLFSKRWDGQLGKFDQATQNVRDLMLVHEVLDTMTPYIVSGSDNKPGIFFEGNLNGFVGVSTKSVFDKQYQSVVRLSVAQRSDFTFDVVYEESPMIADVLRSTQEPLQ